MVHFNGNFKKFHMPFISTLGLYFDLGTAYTRLAVKDKGVVLKEPTYLGYNSRIKEYIFFGSEAKVIEGKSPDFIKIVRPVVNGILSDFDAETAFIKKCMEKSVAPYISTLFFLKPTYRALVSIPLIATEIEQKAVEECLIKAGCASVTLIEKPLATASGCGFNVLSHDPHFIIDLGAGLIELSIVSGGGIVSHKTLKNGGEHMNKIVANYMHLKHGIILGERSSEQLKIDLLQFSGEDKMVAVRGKSLETGLPKSVKVKTGDIKEALLSTFNQIVDSTKELIELSPPEIADEIFRNGITLTGHMAGILGLDEYLAKEIQIDVHITEQYTDATIYGLIQLDKNPQDFAKLYGI
ncbi:MAG: rod shape-determining protein [Candidatus Roizmanbacteria bacterium]